MAPPKFKARGGPRAGASEPSMTEVYLDHNATHPPWPEVVRTVADILAAGGNPSSVHGRGRAARQAVETARARVAALVGAIPERVVFTAGATEANNLALHQVAGPVLVSAVEHPSVARARADAVAIPVGADGILDLDALARLLAATPRPGLVSVMLANNETGVVQPVAAAARLARESGALFHCDAVQGPGRIALDALAAADFVSLSAHKIGGPQGVGALIAREPASLRPQIRGGGQERGVRAGTENTAGIAGFGVAADIVAARLSGMADVARRRDRMEAAIRAVDPDAVVFGAAAPRLPNTSAVAMPGVAAEIQLVHFDLAGIAVSAGAACSSGRIEAPAVLLAMGVPEALARTAIRVSLGHATTDAEIDRFVAAWAALRERTRARRCRA